MPDVPTTPQLRVLALGDAAATIVFGERIAPEIHARVADFCAALERLPPIDGVEEWAPAFASATIWYDPDRIGFETLAERLTLLAGAPAIARAPGPLHDVPFCADSEFAPDLDEIAARNGFSRADYLENFTALVLDVYMLGFQPGFAYLGALPEALSAPRLATPRKQVPAGSVAVADLMCAAYPHASPGGWRLIGRTPARLFDIANPQRPTLLAPGDRVRWRAISRAEFERLQRLGRGGS
jgi:KipI family sensor histidine kinase inhibitor